MLAMLATAGMVVMQNHQVQRHRLVRRLHRQQDPVLERHRMMVVMVMIMMAGMLAMAGTRSRIEQTGYRMPSRGSGCCLHIHIASVTPLMIHNDWMLRTVGLYIRTTLVIKG